MSLPFFRFNEFLLVVFQLKGQQASLVVIPEKENKEISYQLADSEHFSFYTLYQTIQATPEGIFRINLPIQSPVTLDILTEERLLIRAYLTKESSDTIRIQNNQAVFSGTNAVYNECLQKIQQIEEYCHSISYDRQHELETIDSLNEFKQKSNEKRADLMTFLKKKNVSADFIHNQSYIIDCIFTNLYYNKILNLYNKKKITDEWLRETKEQLSFDFQHEETLCYSQYERMLYMNTTINYFIIEKHSPQEIDKDKINNREKSGKCLGQTDLL